jgi:hypothetical protein
MRPATHLNGLQLVTPPPDGLCRHSGISLNGLTAAKIFSLMHTEFVNLAGK